MRRSSKSVGSTIVEGYGRRCCKADFVKFIIDALASNDETIDHLETLHETQSLTDEYRFKELTKPPRNTRKKIEQFPTARSAITQKRETKPQALDRYFVVSSAQL
ncbi:MAG: four helix bundle protein [Bacteroidota bacterium]